jgi:hypothetical protein
VSDVFDRPKGRPGRPGGGGSPIGVNGVLRFLIEIFALVSLAFWGYLAWPFPFPAVFFIIGLPLFAAALWALFRSPRAVVKNDPVGKAIVEIAVMGAACYCWFSLGHPIVGAVFGVIALISGIVNFRRENA